MSAKRIGVFLCHCGGNISDYLDGEKVREAAAAEPGIAVARTFRITSYNVCYTKLLRIVVRGIVHSPKEHKLVMEIANRVATPTPVRSELNYRGA